MTADDKNSVPDADGNADLELIGLMRRREALLDLASALRDADELDLVTRALESGMSDQALQIRSLSFDADRELVTKLGGLEPIHPLDQPNDPTELADRLCADRRCFILEHPRLLGHPLNVVWVALMESAPKTISSVIGAGRQRLGPSAAKVAVFYSIWNVERGLVGIPGGAALLGLAMERIGREFTGVHTYVTLSPIPEFRSWATSSGALHNSQVKVTDLGTPLEDSRSDLLESCAKYLTEMDSRGRLIDPVARFHLRNGARLWRINWQGDLSQRGLDRSWGLMANYRYAPEDREANKLALSQGQPAVSSDVAKILDESHRR